jgi:hypothetical protein
MLAPASLGGQAQEITAPAKKPGAGTAWKASRTPDGQPDLQGIWLNNGATPLERPAQLAGRALLTDEELRVLKERAARLFNDPDGDNIVGDAAFLTALANVEHVRNPNAPDSRIYMIERVFDHRTSLIVAPAEGTLPFTPEGKRRQEAALEARRRPVPAGPEDLPNDLRCISWGVPNLVAGANSYSQILQRRGYAVLFSELIHDARIIPLDGRPHPPSSVRQWHGDSRGRWEGQTLVVDTTNFSSKSYFLGSTENLHLLERFTRVAEDQINYEITASDPGTWAQPWTAVMHLQQSHDQIYEYACHEGNYDVMIDMLAGARAVEKAAEAAKRKSK